MSVSLYNTGVSSLLAAQQQLATTGNNIANVNTEGYTRQRAEQNAAIGLYTGGNHIGGGTYIEDVRRVYDQFSYKEQLLSQTNLSHSDSLNTDLTQLNEVMTFSGAALNTSLEEFYKSINSITDNPSDLGLRNMAINHAKVLSADFNSLNENFNQMVKSTNGEITQIADHITQISQEIGKINEQVLHGQNKVSGQPNDLLDARDRLVNDLSKYTSVQTVTDNNNVMSVMIGNGATLVAGITPMSVSVRAGNPDPNKTVLHIVSPNSAVQLNGNVVGGIISAKYEFRDEHLAQVTSEMNRIAMAISETMNSAQHDGLDLNEEEGLDLFTNINTTQLQKARVLTPTSNLGSLQVSVNITDVSKIPTNDFSVEYDGVNYIMTNLADNSTLNIGSPSPGTINNLSSTNYGFEFIENSGTPAAGDTFIIKPTKDSASLMHVTLASGAGIAASSAVEVTPSDTNIGGASVAIVGMDNPVAAQTYVTANNLTVDVYEVTPGIFNYRVFDSTIPGVDIASGSYITGDSEVVHLPSTAAPLFQIEIKGSPFGSTTSSREEFSIFDSFGTGNSTNSALTGLTQEIGIVNGNKDTFGQSLGGSTANVGSKARSAELTSATDEALFTQAFNRNQSTSGVNLDEEAANLLKFQQAYQASSQIISIANTIFDTLLQSLR